MRRKLSKDSISFTFGYKVVKNKKRLTTTTLYLERLKMTFNQRLCHH